MARRESHQFEINPSCHSEPLKSGKKWKRIKKKMERLSDSYFEIFPKFFGGFFLNCLNKAFKAVYDPDP